MGRLEEAHLHNTSEPTEFSDAVEAFVTFWRSLRQAELVPQAARFLDCADPRFQPFVSFNDVDPDGDVIVTLVGTALADMMHADWTGLSTSAFLPPAVARGYREELTMCAGHPCGMWELTNFTTSQSRAIKVEVISLPLKLGSGRRFRVARFHRLVEVMHRSETMSGEMRWRSKAWVDIGGGLPSRDPLPSAMPGP